MLFPKIALIPNEPRCEKSGLRGFRPGLTQTVQPQNMAIGLKFRILVEEGLYYMYPHIENKGADQLRSNCAADLRLCFRICKKPVFSQRGSNYPRIKDKRHELYCHEIHWGD